MPDLGLHVYRCLLLCYCLLLTHPVAASTALKEIRAWRAPDHVRVVLDFAQPFSYRYFFLEHPDRLVINLPDTRQSVQFVHSIKSLTQHPLIQSVRHAYHDDVLRVVLDLNYPVTTEPFTLEPQADYGHRLVFDLYHHLPVVRPSIPEKTAVPKKIPATAVKVPTNNVPKNIDAILQNMRDVVIVIDPGHGGEDPGALGYHHIKEKDLVLAISRHIQQKIRQQKGFQAVLTRSGDYYIGLQQRTQIARKHGADLFLSIHANSFTKNRKVQGAIIFALSDGGATSALGRWMEKKENDADLIGGMRQANLAKRPQKLREVLLDLSMTATLTRSIGVGKDLLHSMQQLTHLHSTDVEQANFVVLRSPDIPSLLIETGFISNAQEAVKLKNQAYQQKLAAQIAAAVTAYFQDTPPAGTYLAWKKYRAGQPFWHQVQAGETLSHLAVRYDVGVAEIKQLNQLQGDIIWPGQKLKILQ